MGGIGEDGDGIAVDDCAIVAVIVVVFVVVVVVVVVRFGLAKRGIQSRVGFRNDTEPLTG